MNDPEAFCQLAEWHSNHSLTHWVNNMFDITLELNHVKSIYIRSPFREFLLP